MVTDVLQIAIGLLVDQLALTSELAKDVAFRPDDAVQLHQPTTDGVDALHLVARRIVEQVVLDLLEFVGERVDNGQDRVHEAIDEPVQHEVGALGHEVLGPLGNLVDGLQAVSVDGDEMVGAEEHVELVSRDVVAVGLNRSEPDEEDARAIVVDLGALREVQAVFDGERMKVEANGKRVERVLVGPENVDPGPAGCLSSLDVIETADT